MSHFKHIKINVYVASLSEFLFTGGLITDVGIDLELGVQWEVESEAVRFSIEIAEVVRDEDKRGVDDAEEEGIRRIQGQGVRLRYSLMTKLMVRGRQARCDRSSSSGGGCGCWDPLRENTGFATTDTGAWK